MQFKLLALCLAQLSTFSHALPVLEERAAAIVLGAASSFGAIAATSLASSGATNITGNAGTYPGSSDTGFGPGVVSGSIDTANTASANAEAAILTAYNDASALAVTQTLASSDLGGLILGPGVYNFPTQNAVLSTTLTLNGATNPNGQFIFRIHTTFVTAATLSKVVLIGGAQACNVYFIVGSSATINAGSTLQGNILAYTAIAVKSGASNVGTLGALNAAITLIDNKLTSQPSCTT